jgi:hypothetical protein
VPDAITDAIAGLTARTIARRFTLENERAAKMDRITEKFSLAGGVVARVTTHLESKLDELIAREEPVKTRLDRAVAPHHAKIDAQLKDLDTFERQIALIENADPFADGGKEDPPGHNRSV